ncbi:hypothetical protein MP477_11825 [Chryseobacterium sp. WG23]|uniref:hypothetical protein n=1 Tax=Chryseobacterium sp. WG23 TaxID=2926910 RepID=UPI00211DCD21|nr:hypothetical protein [Chryseobacterium sp. WG23]MCQ9635649.1 hypothetical protein [Chryseobacterium sp. WG23]
MNKQQFTLKQIKETFLYKVQNMSLEEIDDDGADEFLAQRYYSEFENHWEELSDNRPEISYDQQKQILNDADEICKSMCKSLHHELEACIYDDYILIATYLIAGEHDKHIAGMCLSYMEEEIPMLSIIPTDKRLQDIFKEFQLSVRISRLRDSAKRKGNL